MPEHQIGNIKYHTFTLFDNFGIKHAMISRHGGVSQIPWNTLNLATTVGDDKNSVGENINRVYKAFKIERGNIFDVWQVHSDRVVHTQSPRKADESHQRADAIVTNQHGLTLLMRFADCVPILLYDPKHKVIGIVHAGWKGTILKIVSNTVRAMNDIYGSSPNDLISGIGPSIAAHHYEVGPDVIRQASCLLGNEASECLISFNGSTHFDLWKANQKILESIGVNQIEVSGICTACNTHDWFSHRAENGRSGRFGVFITL
jgi:YfiH family protein